MAETPHQKTKANVTLWRHKNSINSKKTFVFL